jgi:hypothetical protein
MIAQLALYSGIMYVETELKQLALNLFWCEIGSCASRQGSRNRSHTWLTSSSCLPSNHAASLSVLLFPIMAMNQHIYIANHLPNICYREATHPIHESSLLLIPKRTLATHHDKSSPTKRLASPNIGMEHCQISVSSQAPGRFGTEFPRVRADDRLAIQQYQRGPSFPHTR